MLKKIVLLLVATTCLVAFSSAALAAEDAYGDESAEDSSFWGVGARFAWTNFKKPIYVYNEENNPGLAATEYGGQNFGGMLLWGVSDQLVLSLSIEVGFWNHFIHPYTSTGDPDPVNVNFVSVGALLGAKYYLTPPKAQSVRFYLYGGVGGYFSRAINSATVTTEQNAVINSARQDYAGYTVDDCGSVPGLCNANQNQKVSEEDWVSYTENTDAYAAAAVADGGSQDKFDAQVDTVSSLSSPIVAVIAVGAEFFANKNFSIGADIIGLRTEFSWADVGQIGDTFTGDPWTGNQRIINLYFYSALTMSFNLTGEDESVQLSAASAGGQAGAAQPATGWSGGGNWSTGPAAPSASGSKAKTDESVAPDSSIGVTASDDAPPPPPPAK